MSDRRLAAAALVALAWLGAGVARAQGTAPGWLARTPVARTFDALGATDADTRRAAAERLATVGSHDRVVAALSLAIAHETVPEVFAVMLRSLARRAEPGDTEAFAGAWDRATALERGLIAAALGEMDDEPAREALLRMLRDGLSAACEVLVRTDERVRWLGTQPIDRAIALCLSRAAPSSARDEALVRATALAEPDVARVILGALAASPAPSESAVELALRASAADPSLAPLTHEILSRGDPARLSAATWVSLLTTPSRPAALRALLTIAPAQADEALATDRALGGEDARSALELVLAQERSEDLPRIAAFVRVDATRDRALEALSTRPGGASLLAAEPVAPDRDVALALAGPEGEVREALLGQSPSRLVRALVGAVSPEACAPDASAPAPERRAAAACLSLLPTGSETAAHALEQEREPSVVAWLVLAAREAPSSGGTLEALLSAPETAAAALSRVPTSLPALRPSDRRHVEALVVRLARASDARTRAEAIRALGALGRPVHAALVVGALEDPTAIVRLAAARALPHLGVDVLRDTRARGRLRVETDPRVASALRAEPLPSASRPLHVRIVAHDPALAPNARVRLELANGASLELTPVEGELVLRDVPDAPARAELRVGPR